MVTTIDHVYAGSADIALVVTTWGMLNRVTTQRAQMGGSCNKKQLN